MSYEYEGGFEMQPEPILEVEILGPILKGVGNIKSTMPESKYPEFASAIRESIVRVEDTTPACVDGRRCIAQADGTGPRIRPRLAGGSLAPFMMCGLGSDEFARGFTHEAKNLDDAVSKVLHLDEQLGSAHGAHFDCGAANGLIEHVASVANPKRPNLKVASQLIANEAKGFDITIAANRIRTRAKALCKCLEKIGWDGTRFTEMLARHNPGGVEKLAVDHKASNHGHAEDAWVLIDGPVDNDGYPLHSLDDERLENLTSRRAFVLNLNSLRRDAYMLSATIRQKNELMLASLDWHLNGVGYNLTDGSQPVFFVTIS